MKFSRIAAIAAAMALTAGTASAQTDCNSATAITAASNCKVTDNVSVTVPWLAQLTVTGGNTSLTQPGISDFGAAAGVTDDDKLTINVKANAVYSIATSAPGSFTYTGLNSGSKNSSDLKLRFGVDASSTTGSFAAIGGSIATNATATASRNYKIGYNTMYNWATDKPGSYAIVVTYTLTAP